MLLEGDNSKSVVKSVHVRLVMSPCITSGFQYHFYAVGQAGRVFRIASDRKDHIG